MVRKPHVDMNCHSDQKTLWVQTKHLCSIGDQPSIRVFTCHLIQTKSQNRSIANGTLSEQSLEDHCSQTAEREQQKKSEVADLNHQINPHTCGIIPSLAMTMLAPG